LLNHVLPLARFGASPTHVVVLVAWCEPATTIMLAREVGAPNNAIRRFLAAHACTCWWLLKPITGRSPSTAATLDWANEIFIVNGIDKHAGAGTRVEFDGARNLEGGHIL
jgi:hypothetical protein